MPIKLDYYPNGYNQKVAHFAKNGIHMTVAPHNTGSERKQISGWDVYFWGDKEGKMDTSHALNSISLDGNTDDLEEIADTYARRLDAGVKVEDIFKDTEEQTRVNMKKLLEDFQAGRIK